MTRIRGYHRPTTMAEALTLLTREDVTTRPLGGGTRLNASPTAGAEDVVDLQDLDLDTISRDGANLRWGAMATLQAVIDHESTPPLLRDLAHREAPNTFRNVATIGGTVATADPESPLLAGLLAHDAELTVASPNGEADLHLADLLAEPAALGSGLITSVAVPRDGVGAYAATGRTPADLPIVLVAGVRRQNGTVKLAATGAAATPVVFDAGEVDSLRPPGDFRGSPEYRRHLIAVLASRVFAELEEGAR